MQYARISMVTSIVSMVASHIAGRHNRIDSQGKWLALSPSATGRLDPKQLEKLGFSRCRLETLFELILSFCMGAPRVCCSDCRHNTEISGQARPPPHRVLLSSKGRKRNPNPNVLVRICSGGVGVFHVKGWGSKSSVCPSKPGKSNFFGGISRDFAGISRDFGPKSLRKKKVSVQFSFPTVVPKTPLKQARNKNAI